MDSVVASLESPLRRSYADAGRLARPHRGRLAWERRGLLRGEVEFGWPVLALHVRRDLGQVRHALSQRVVAGVLQVYLPPPVQPTAHALSAPPVQTVPLNKTGADHDA